MRFQQRSAMALLLVASLVGPAVAQSVAVVLGEVEAGPEGEVLLLPGELRAVRSTVLAAEVAGPVAEVLAESGDRVEAGAVLAVIREQQADLALRAARGRVAEAEAGVDRAVINERRLGRLLKRKALSQDEYDTARVELNKARAILATRRAEAELVEDTRARHRVRAPFAGVVVQRHLELGQWLDDGDPSFALEDTAHLRAVLSVPQQYYGRIQPNGEVTLRFEALPGEQRSGRLDRSIPWVSRNGRSFEVWIDLDNSDHRLVSGLSLRAELPLQADGAGKVMVSRDAVLRGPGGEAWLWAAESSDDTIRVVRVSVEVISAVEQRLVVRASDLVPGMQVVVRGNERLAEGQLVRLAPAEG